jgi:uncharacterized protein with von Willebrand factor type A (vWA) domain
MPGFTNTAAAMGAVETSMLTSAAGDRSGVDNFVIVLTDGRSNVNTAQTASAAQRVRNNARVIAVGVGAARDVNR